ncbi:MAG: hypothetical protein KDE28_08955 [Anaerolineales bacterium]|nr:hypothetical protein [Anaerolineales bacterium]
MDDTFDVRPYLRSLWQARYWLLGSALLAAILTYGLLSLLPEQYEATSLIAISEPRLVVQLDPRIDSAGDRQIDEAYPELAISDEILRQLLAQMEPVADINNTRDLARLVTAEAGADNTLLRLTVAHTEAAVSARIVNLWSEIFVAWANEVLGAQGESQLLFFSEQLAAAAAEWSTAQTVLTEFQARNRGPLLDNEILALQTEQTELLTELSDLTTLRLELDTFQTSLQTGAPSYADQVTLLMLQLRVYGSDPGGSLQFQLGAEAPGDIQPAELPTEITELLTAVDSKEAALLTALTAIEPALLNRQAERQALEAEELILRNDVTVAEETVRALALKVEEEKIVTQDATKGVRLASLAGVPGAPAGPSRLLLSLLAAVLGGGLAAGMVLLSFWWRAGETV